MTHKLETIITDHNADITIRTYKLFEDRDQLDDFKTKLLDQFNSVLSGRYQFLVIDAHDGNTVVTQYVLSTSSIRFRICNLNDDQTL